MIPQFPEFKKVELSDRAEIEAFVEQHPPYSDYNFTSLWTYNTASSMRVCFLHDNLVYEFPDYVSKQPFLTFLGTSKVGLTARTLIAYAKEHGLPEQLHLIPHVVAEALMNEEGDILVEEDGDNHDHILSVEKLKDFFGGELKTKRNAVTRFVRDYGTSITVRELALGDSAVQQAIQDLFDLWATRTPQEPSDIASEHIALQRLLWFHASLRVYGIGIFHQEQLIAFSIDEVTHAKHGIIHYEKANTDFAGIYEFLKQQSALYFSAKGCEYINYEQDMGIEGLRKAKTSYRPTHALKKYTVRLSAST